MLPAYCESVFFLAFEHTSKSCFSQAEDLVDAAYALGVEAWRQRMLGAQAVNGPWEKLQTHIFDVMLLKVFFCFFWRIHWKV